VKVVVPAVGHDDFRHMLFQLWEKSLDFV